MDEVRLKVPVDADPWIHRERYDEIRRFVRPVDSLVPHVESIKVSCSDGAPCEGTKAAILAMLRAGAGV